MTSIETLIKLGKEHLDDVLYENYDIQYRMEAYNSILITLGKIEKSYELERFDIDLSVGNIIPTHISQECLKTSIETDGYDFEIIQYIYNVLAKYVLSTIVTEQPQALKQYTKISTIKNKDDVVDIFKSRVDEFVCDVYDDYDTYRELIKEQECIRSHIDKYYKPNAVYNIYDEVDIENIISLLGTENTQENNTLLVDIFTETSNYLLVKLIHNGLWEVIGDYNE